jgi:hypothetical protein
VDVEEVLKANKEKEAAAKRERERQRQEQSSGMSSEVEGLAGGRSSGQMDIPKDRTQLANMRVIRRNLVYAVGLPPNIANEDQLRKAEYFGQYGKIAKIVLNRNQVTPSTESRRGSASAYVTFVHKVRISKAIMPWSFGSHDQFSQNVFCCFFRRIRWLVFWHWMASTWMGGIFELRMEHRNTAPHL